MIVLANQSRQPTPGVPQDFNRAPLARRGCAQRWANRSGHLTATMKYLKGLLAEDCPSSKESGLEPHGAHQQRYAGQAARRLRGRRIIEQKATRHGTGADIWEVPRRSSAQPTGSKQGRVSPAVSDRTFVATRA
jgi:hypothetical protein